MPNQLKDAWESVHSGRARHFLDQNLTLPLLAAILAGGVAYLQSETTSSTPEQIFSAASDIRNTTHESLEEALKQQDPPDEGMVLVGESR